MHKYKSYKAKNGDNFVKTELLLYITNFVIDNLFTQLSYN